MSDEELALLFMIAVYLLEQHRQRRIRGMFNVAAASLIARQIELQVATITYFANMYQNRQAWVYHREEENQFDVYYTADLNTRKDLDPNYWHTHYHMSRETFDFLCERVRPFMAKIQTNMRETIPVQKRVAVGLWWLANGGSYISIGQAFGISRSIVCQINKDFVSALVMLRHHFIIWPRTPESCAHSISTFQNLSPLPHVFGAIGGTHVKISAPERSALDYFDKKHGYSIGCQGVCDGSLRFLSMSAGFPGSIDDSRILHNTWIFREAVSQQILTTPSFHLNEAQKIRPYLVGDASYPLADWLIKPFSHVQNMEDRKRVFNSALSQARVYIDRAFGLLKGRWRILTGKLNFRPTFAADVVIACTVLHNICQDLHEPVDHAIDPCNDEETEALEASSSSDVIRESLVRYINENKQNCFE